MLLLALLCFACLFGRPLYWGVVARLEPDGDNAGEGGTEEEALMGASASPPIPQTASENPKPRSPKP